MLPAFALPILACPACGGDLAHDADGGERLRCAACARDYPVAGGVARFVENDAHVKSFSIEWTRHARTQLDGANAWTRTEEKLARMLGAPIDEVRGQIVLDAAMIGRRAPSG